MLETLIRRPVLSVVISLLIFLVGLRAMTMLQVRQYPELTNTVITITTSYPGADSELMQGFVTQPIEKAVAGADGIDYITSTSSPSTSVVSVYVRLNYDPNAAFTNVQAKVNQVRSQLPRDIEDPVLVKSTGQSFASLYLAFTSEQMSDEEITEYVTQVIQPKLSVVAGVASADVFGARNFAMRIWLDPKKLAQYNISTEQVTSALQANNFQAAAGSTKGVYQVFGTVARTDVQTADDFRRLVIRNDGSQLVRLGDVASVDLGAQSADTTVTVNGQRAVFVGVSTTPDANQITVIREVLKLMPQIRADLPPGLTLHVAYDATQSIVESINEVLKTVFEATIIVLVVIFLFLGSLRSVIIPVVTIPLSLVGVGIALLALGFSINLLTLLALVLAIGLVVDDAIVVVENVHRHIEEGLTPFQAAIKGIREIARPVVSMSITLAAVYAPIAFTTGLTGALFREFALTLAGAVIISGLVALTLSPMMCARLLKPNPSQRGFSARIDRFFTRFQAGYRRLLAAQLNDRAPTVVFGLIVVVMLAVLFPTIQSELAPDEDQGALFVSYTGPSNATIEYMNIFTEQIGDRLETVPEIDGWFAIAGLNNQASQGFGVTTLKPLAERERNAKTIAQTMQPLLSEVSGVNASVFSPPPLPTTGFGLPISFVITTTADYEQLVQVSDQILQNAQASGRFLFIDSDLKFDTPKTILNIDRDQAAAYGITMQDIASALATMNGGNYVNLINIGGRSYRVIPQSPRQFRLNPQDLTDLYVTAANGQAVPLSAVASIDKEIGPAGLNRFNQLNSATFSGLPMIGTTLGDALTWLQEEAARTLPAGFSIDYAGQSRQYVQEGSALYITFAFALIIIYLVLAAQYESLRDPLVILVSVPLSIVGALIPLALGISTLNIYSQIGLVTLIGLITKHGILIAEVARERQIDEGLSRKEAVLEAATIRLRPVLMTTAAMIAGLAPLLFASGAGAQSRFSMALVIVAGMAIGTLFTLFVLPVVYTFLASDHSRQRERDAAEQRAIEAMERGSAASHTPAE